MTGSKECSQKKEESIGFESGGWLYSVHRGALKMDASNEKSESNFLRFGDVTLDLERRIPRCSGEIVKLSEEYVNALILLIKRRPNIVSIKELSQTFGADESSVPKQVQRLRRVLGDSAILQKFIKTVPKRGYR